MKMEPKFSKEKLLKSKKFEKRRDILSALLSAETEYTIAEVETLIAEYMEREVK